MRCAEVHPNLAAFVLDGLEPEEAAEIRRHLASCPRCRDKVRELRKVNRALEAAPPPADPPSYLKDGILSQVRAVFVALGVFFGFLREEPPVATIQLVPTRREAVGLEGYWGVAEIRPQPSGNQQVELKLNNFEEPKADSYYELWFVSGESRISAGSFTSVGEGETRVLLNAPPETRNYRTLLITEEHIDDHPTLSEEVALKGEMP
jgi:hypothetical protein